MMQVCEVCRILDNDEQLKECSYCSICKAWICKRDLYRLDRRMRAGLKK